MIWKRKILVTGATGYVGSALLPALADTYSQVVGYCNMAFGNAIANTPSVPFIQGDVRDTQKLASALEGVTDVVWLAGIVTDALVDMNVELSREINVGALHAALELCAAKGIERFILMSSSSVYGSTDEPATEDTPCRPMTAYAQTKLDQEAELLGKDWPFIATALRSATLCGPAPRMRLDTIVNAFCKQAYFDCVITVHGGDQWRSNLNVKEMVRIYKLLLDAPGSRIDGHVWNATSGNDTALNLAQRVASRLIPYRAAAPEIIVDPTLRDDRHYRMSGKKLMEQFDYCRRNSIEGAIDDNFFYFRLGGIRDPNNDIYYNTRRMAESMKERMRWTQTN